jgi:hypothetical protein
VRHHLNPAIRHVLSRKPRFTQVEAFAEIAEQLTDRDYWKLAGHIWARNLVPRTAVYFYAALWHKIFQSPRPHRSHFARNPADRLKWDQMGDEITCYRGCGPDNGDGCFFSLDRSTAELFGHLHDPHGRILTLQCRKSDCVFCGGKQQEVIPVPMLRLKRCRPAPATLQELRQKLDSLKRVRVLL